MNERLTASEKQKLSIIQIALIACVFVFCTAGAVLIRRDYCPDESIRQMLTEWIFRHQALPTGNEPELIMPGWGFSYALYPYLSSVINAFFMGIVSLLCPTDGMFLLASRMCSVLSVTGFCLYSCRLGNLLFKSRPAAALFAVIAVFLPQVMFLGMYQNSDSLALMSLCMVVFYFLSGYRSGWSVKDCLGLAVSVSIALLSYYSIYGWLLVFGVGFAACCLGKKETRGLFLRRSALILGVVLVLAGWFFIRNAVLHDGDFLGLSTAEKHRNDYIARGNALMAGSFRPSDAAGNTPLKAFLKDQCGWLRLTVRSFIAAFGYMNIFLTSPEYYFYYLVFGLGCILYLVFLVRGAVPVEQRRLFLLLALSGLLTFALSYWQSYTSDWQPQGRYVISCIIALSYMISWVSDRLSLRAGNRKSLPAVFLSVLWIGMFLRIFFGIMLPGMTV